MQHKNITGADVHVSHAWAYADATARTAATGFAATDVGKIAHQQADNTFWFLADHDPITWSQSGGAGMVAAEHTHAIDDVTGLQTALDGKADTGHNHDAAYAALGHDHDADYAALGHNHDADYSPIGHNHDADYAALGHSHALNDLSDVSTAGATDGQVLGYNSGSWAPVTPSGGGGGGSSNPTASVRQTVLSGAVDSNGFPNFLSAGTGLSVNVAATTTPIVTTYAAGFDSDGKPVDYFGRIAADTTISSLTASSTCYLYADYAAGTVTLNHSTIAPVYSVTAPLTDITPTMTSNSAPSPYVVSASTEVSGTYAAWKAVDGNSSTHGWLASATTGWWQIDWNSANTIATYTVYGSYNAGQYSPKDWTLKGSSTGAFAGEETVLDTRTNQTGWAAAEGRQFTVASPGSYRYYRLDVTANNGGAGELDVMRLVFYGVSVGQHWFDLSTMKMKRWNGTAWEDKNRTFWGEAVTDGSGVTSVRTYALRGSYKSGRFATAATTQYIKNHNLGTDDLTAELFVATTAGGSLIPTDIYSGGTGATLGYITRNTIDVNVHPTLSVANGPNSAGTFVEAQVVVTRRGF